MLLGPTKTVSGRNSTSALAMGPKLETVSVKGLMSVGVTHGGCFVRRRGRCGRAILTNGRTDAMGLPRCARNDKLGTRERVTREPI